MLDGIIGKTLIWTFISAFFAVGIQERHGYDMATAWLLFFMLAGAPGACWRLVLRPRHNFMDWLGYAAGFGVWAFMMAERQDDLALGPMMAVITGTYLLFPAVGVSGYFFAAAFVADYAPKPRPAARRPRQQPYSVPDDGDEFGYRPSRYGSQEPPEGPYGGGGYEEGGYGPQGAPRASTGPRQTRYSIHVETFRLEHRRAGPGPEHETRQRRAGGTGLPAVRQEHDRRYRDALRRWGLREGCTFEEVRARYRELSKKYHPDRGGTDAQFQQLQEDFKILSRLDT